MNSNFMQQLVTVATAIVGLAIVAVIVSNRAQTASVIKAGGNALSGAIGAAVSPLTGSSFTGGGVVDLPSY